MIPKISLNDGNEIPQVGLGLWKNKDEAEFDMAFKTALQDSYRHFDSAQAYNNEQYLGAALRHSGLQRSDVWVTTKIGVQHFGHKHALRSFDESLRKLQTDYADLILLHFPVTLLRKKSWQALEEIKAAGKARSIGVSNYTIRHLKEMEKYARELPAVNQVELHVFLQQPELLRYCRDHDIVVEAYSPLAHARAGAQEPLLQELATKYSKTYAQIMLRWCVQKDTVILPKSVTPSRIKQNIDIFDFEISDDDMTRLAGLDRGFRTCWDPTRVP